MSAAIAVVSGFGIIVLLMVYNLLLTSANAEKEGSKTFRFFGSVLPGLFLFLLIVCAVFHSILWWFGILLYDLG
jgi:hypothetical protein